MPYTTDDLPRLRPTILALAEATKRDAPQAWTDAHRAPAPAGSRFIRLLARACQAAGLEVGCNGKRGNTNDLSQDALAVAAAAAGAGDASGRFPGVFIIDVIARAGAPDAYLTWQDVTGATLAAGTRGAFVDPVLSPDELPGGTVPPPVTTPTPTPTPPSTTCRFQPAPDLGPLEAHLATINAKLDRLQAELEARIPAKDDAAAVIEWLQNNRVRVRF